MAASTTKVKRTRTVHYPKLLNGDCATILFNHFKNNIEWEDGVRSKTGFTRKAKAMSVKDDMVLNELIIMVLPQIGITEAILHGIYLNYYRTGEDWTPNHAHPKMRQVVISLGATRILTVGARSFCMANGDVIVFGSTIHGVPKEQYPEQLMCAPGCSISCACRTFKEGRISVALFLSK
jgi:hypothetical protein